MGKKDSNACHVRVSRKAQMGGNLGSIVIKFKPITLDGSKPEKIKGSKAPKKSIISLSGKCEREAQLEPGVYEFAAKTAG